MDISIVVSGDLTTVTVT